MGEIIEKIVLFLILPILIVWLLGIIPPINIVNKVEIIHGIQNIGVTMKSVASFFPVGVFFVCMIVWVLVYNVELLMKLGMWIIRKLPFNIS